MFKGEKVVLGPDKCALFGMPSLVKGLPWGYREQTWN